MAGQPRACLRLQDQWQRTCPSLPLAQPLIRIGAVGPLAGNLARRDLLVQAAKLRRQCRTRAATNRQPPPGGELATATDGGGASGPPEMTSWDKLSAELDTLRIDVTHQVMKHHLRLLTELGAERESALWGPASASHFVHARGTGAPGLPKPRRVTGVDVPRPPLLKRINAATEPPDCA
ncbi:hypothetical protein [Streptomyces acidicola]|uniref:hypothetical protein n=1 Tax=Streptomyces acidicola TaxID=2596892 RepID=UPI0034144C91